jgi:hypothetical protein
MSYVIMATISKQRRNEALILSSFSISKRNEPAIDAGRTSPLAGGDPSGPWRGSRPHPRTPPPARPDGRQRVPPLKSLPGGGGSPSTVTAGTTGTLFPSANLTIRSSCASLRGFAVAALITACVALLAAGLRAPASLRSGFGPCTPIEATRPMMSPVARVTLSKASAIQCWASKSTRTGISSGLRSSEMVSIRFVSRSSSLRHPS